MLKLASKVSTFAPICLPAGKDADTYSVNNFAGIYEYGQSLTNIMFSLDTDIDFTDSSTDQLLLQVTQLVPKSNCGANYTLTVSNTDHILCTGK